MFIGELGNFKCVTDRRMSKALPELETHIAKSIKTLVAFDMLTCVLSNGPKMI